MQVPGTKGYAVANCCGIFLFADVSRCACPTASRPDRHHERRKNFQVIMVMGRMDGWEREMRTCMGGWWFRRAREVKMDAVMMVGMG